MLLFASAETRSVGGTWEMVRLAVDDQWPLMQYSMLVVLILEGFYQVRKIFPRVILGCACLKLSQDLLLV